MRPSAFFEDLFGKESMAFYVIDEKKVGRRKDSSL